MKRFIANARMYAVTPEAEAAWRMLVEAIVADAELDFDYLAYPAPQPLEVLWRRDDLGAVQMCGYPIALGLADVVPIAAPIPAAPWAGGRPVYRSDLIVRRDAPYRSIEDTFGGRAGWTVEHSHSGFNAFRHHLLGYRSPDRPALYGSMAGNLITARRILDSVLDGSIDIGPLDAYWHDLIAHHRPDLTAGIRVLASTDLAPIPAFVAAPSLPAEAVDRLKRAFAAAATRPWFAAPAETLRLTGFAPVTHADFATTLAWDRAAKAAGYPVPA
ncbi:phosphate/phosphite/phosphonate ABC transporter substrate-binding protein [Prosthecodimorpha staleyi]|uniref:Phosphate/phosphite/phosphonate ABC transporter substrate-binding protein n=1 Tax=Prosthecodimorpha staleyi TaxID=2840188 RepID=A0A947GB75_9HYPH|nr:phosphate/phosphite/phosphonate ABC transporter substrate-binding protein [Prosthecodimorpha staleyi]MBT9289953.1 phosphate/phosphite/phosphonate ABC transporter substrate-binding protein [Prosthecodimorpha staleyi]